MKTSRLGDLVDITIGRTPSRSDESLWDKNKDTDNVWLSIADLPVRDNQVGDSKEYISDTAARSFAIVPKGTLLVSFKLTLGRLAYAGRDLRTNEAIAALRNSEDTILNDYLYHYLTHFDWFGYASADQKVKGFTLNKAKLAEIQIVYPESLETQQRITQKLDAAFSRVSEAEELMRRNIENVNMLQKSILAMYLDVANDTHTHRLADIVKIKHGKDWKGLGVGTIPVYGSGGFMNKYVDTYSYNKPTVLLPRKGTITNVFYLEEPFWNVDTVFYTEIDTSKILPKYFYNFIRTVDLQALDSGSGRPSLTQTALYNIPIAVPALDEQQEAVDKIDELSGKIYDLQKHYASKLLKLANLRQSLLAEAFSTTALV